MHKPYTDERHPTRFTRKFEASLDQSECVWHRDKVDRRIVIISGDGWMFQRDNSLPFMLYPNDSFFIKKQTYHRIYKVGNTDLVINIYE